MDLYKSQEESNCNRRDITETKKCSAQEINYIQKFHVLEIILLFMLLPTLLKAVINEPLFSAQAILAY